jgi:hypothetical protein
VILDELGVAFETRRRSIASFTAYERDGSARGLVISNVDEARSRASVRELTGGDREWEDTRRCSGSRGARGRSMAQPAAADPLARVLGRPLRGHPAAA